MSGLEGPVLVFIQSASPERVVVVARAETEPDDPVQVIGDFEQTLHPGDSLFGLSFQDYLDAGVGELEVRPVAD